MCFASGPRLFLCFHMPGHLEASHVHSGQRLGLDLLPPPCRLPPPPEDALAAHPATQLPLQGILAVSARGIYPDDLALTAGTRRAEVVQDPDGGLAADQAIGAAEVR